MLSVEFKSDDLTEYLDRETIIRLLASSDFSQHKLSDEQLLKLLNKSKENHQGIVSLEKHKDASFKIVIDEQKTSVSIVIERAVYGECLIYDDILESLLGSSIKIEFVDTKLLAHCIELNEDASHVIAKGVQPIKGVDSQFTVLFNTESHHVPDHDAHGTVNHYETHSYINVAKNQPVMKRITHTQGTAGMTVFGDTINADNGKAIKFLLDKTVQIDKADPNLLLAAKKGHPLAFENGIHVDDTLTIKNANLSSGNIHFDGSVEITGEVFPNVVIEATGDIFIHGMVENASLISGNNITIGAGILSSKLFDHNDDKLSPECTLIAEGTITGKYCNTIRATAKKDILIETYSMHSLLRAGENIIIGSNNGKGVLIGGTSYASFSIKANVIGSNAYVSTNIRCGSMRSIKKLYKKTRSEFNRRESELSLLSTLLNKIKSQGSPSTVGTVVLKKAKILHDEINKLKQSIIDYEAKLHVLENEMHNTQHAKIKIQKKLYPNVHITINNAQILCNREHESTIIHCEKYQIQFN